MIAADTDALADLLHDELVYTDPAGEQGDKSSDLAAHSTGAFSINSIEIESLVVDPLSAHTVITRVTSDMSGDPFSGMLVATRVWVKRDGRWQIRAAHIAAQS